jgi:hypothetical protein
VAVDKKKKTKTEHEAFLEQMLKNAQRTRELAEKAPAELDAKRAADR